MLGELTGKNESDCSLDLPGRDRGFLVVPCKLRRFLRKLLKDVVDEAVHDPHGFAGDSDVRVDLFENLEDVDLVGLDALRLLLLLLVS